MDSAERAIRARLSLVDFILEVRVARVPASSAFEPLHLRRPVEPDGRRVSMLNKGDLAEAYETEKWMAYMKKKRTCPCIAVNSHKRESTKELLSVVRSRIKHGESDCTGTVLLIGIPNVGKSAIVNAMHHIGGIGAAGDIYRLVLPSLREKHDEFMLRELVQSACPTAAGGRSAQGRWRPHGVGRAAAAPGAAERWATAQLDPLGSGRPRPRPLGGAGKDARGEAGRGGACTPAVQRPVLLSGGPALCWTRWTVGGLGLWVVPARMRGGEAHDGSAGCRGGHRFGYLGLGAPIAGRWLN
ncbi:DAR GTPase 2, mitochondrial [Panicum miliaceum]|uniref:DAR GTPase 2, mitochondrial n=1 Tax=Panicum miliaceum TaxID=4540 RepID=A0A3L6QHK7_PANMI|nr:DAR GTPase 2, mitochondrial [Panicum miliaceum]